MKKFYKVALALAIALGSVSAYAAGSAISSPVGDELSNAAVEVYSVGNVIFVKNAEGKTVTIVDVIAKTSTTAVVVGGQVVTSNISGIAVVIVDGVSTTVYLTK